MVIILYVGLNDVLIVQQKCQVSSEVAPPAGDLSEETDEAQVSGVPPLGEEEGYDADSESNPEDSTRQEEGTVVVHSSRILDRMLCC